MNLIEESSEANFDCKTEFINLLKKDSAVHVIAKLYVNSTQSIYTSIFYVGEISGPSCSKHR